MKQDAEKEFLSLISTHERILHKVSRMYAATETEREDLFQEMVIQLWKSFPSFRGNAKFSTWMYRVAINTAISGFRKSSQRTRHIPLEEVSVLEHPDSTSSESSIDTLYKAIDKLNPLEKGVALLYLEDRSYEEMEEILGISNGALRVKMNRIREKLRQLTKQV